MVKHLYRCGTCKAEVDADAPGFKSEAPACPNTDIPVLLEHTMRRAWAIAGAYVKW